MAAHKKQFSTGTISKKSASHNVNLFALGQASRLLVPKGLNSHSNSFKMVIFSSYCASKPPLKVFAPHEGHKKKPKILDFFT